MGKKILWNYGVFALAMGYLEAAVVVYLRAIYYPQGFSFPLKTIPTSMVLVELGRELATIVMLWFVASLHRGSRKEQFLLFLYVFGIWDLSYYFWLKVVLNWPASWLEWDILFLIPFPWVGPWLAPALVSVGFILVTLWLWNRPQVIDYCLGQKRFWQTEIIAALIILISFFWETGRVMHEQIPRYYPWGLFVCGYLVGLAGLYLFYRRWRKEVS